MSHLAHILVVEDDCSLAEWVTDYLLAQNYEVSVANRGDTAVELILDDQPDLVVLDVMLPGLSGLEVCKKVRPDFHSPILMLTACTEENDEVLGLENGADDYLAKPVRPRVLLARIEALLRRNTAQAPLANTISIGALHIDRDSRSVSLDGSSIELSANEFDLLCILAQSAGQILPRAHLLEKLCGYDYDGFNRAIDVRISRLRKKLNDNAGCPYRIKTIRGKGYLLAQDAW
mgnify:CR=1 FL=1